MHTNYDNYTSGRKFVSGNGFSDRDFLYEAKNLQFACKSTFNGS